MNFAVGHHLSDIFRLKTSTQSSPVISGVGNLSVCLQGNGRNNGLSSSLLAQYNKINFHIHGN